MDFDRELGHQRAASRRRTSAQGMVCTIRLSSSRTRRLTSAAHAASASSSTSVSRLSSNDPASAARASVGSSNASFKISAASRFIDELYQFRPEPRTSRPRIDASTFPLGSKPRTIRAANLRLMQDSYRVVPKPAIGRSVQESRRMYPSGGNPSSPDEWRQQAARERGFETRIQR